MRNRSISFLLALLACGLLHSHAQEMISASAPINAAGRLPVRHVALYKNGVGYFQHDGRVRGDQKVTIDFTTAQLNDVLKSLTTIDLGGGHITGVSYNSTAPLGQRLDTLPIPLGEKTTTAEFLDALRGARVEVRSGASAFTGRLLSVESVPFGREKSDSEDAQEKSELRTQTRISVITDSGDLRSFNLTPATSVRLLDRELNQEVGHYLDLLSSTRDADVRKMTISTEGSGERELRVSYISEVPVWKSTYRIVMPSGPNAKPLLQGWAVVDNTVGEDWDNVQLSLIAGAPQSFVQQISQPYYARRPEVGLPEMAMLTPQTHEQTMETTDQFATLQSPPPAKGMAAGLPGGVVGGVLGGISNGGPRMMTKSGSNALGVGSGVGSGYGAGIFRPGPAAETVDVASLLEAQQTTTATQAIGDLFEYDIKQPVTIRKNQSALVPILQARVDAEKVTLWSPGEARPLRALWLDNSSGLTLDGGSFSIQEGQTFAGEGLMDAIRPGEKRLISYAADPDVQIQSKVKGEGQRVSRVRIYRGVMTHISEEREHRTYIVRNQDQTARAVIIEHPQRKGWELTGGAKPEETSPSAYRFRVNVGPQHTEKLEFDEVHSFGATYQLTNVTPEQIALFVHQGSINPKIESALKPIMKQKDEVAEYAEQVTNLSAKLNGIFDDQKRLRENLQALKGSAEERTLAQRYTSELNRQEDELSSLRKQRDDAQAKHESAQAQLNDMLEKLDMEVKL
jgi:hypothetical protein